MKNCKFNELLGKTLSEITISESSIDFITNTGIAYSQYHEQDCCENVWLDDYDGEITWLLGSEILQAEEVIDSKYNSEALESITYSFYKLSTVKGSCTFNWRGESNGYYSETVSLFVFNTTLE